MHKIKISVIGCGHWGKNLVRSFSTLGLLGAVCDANKTLQQQASESFGVPALSFDQILKDESIEGVVIASPAPQHAEQARRALLAGKHVFVEKPLALDIEESKVLCLLAKEKGLILMVGHLLQYHPAYIKLKELVASGEMGKVQYIYSNRLSLGKIRVEENVFWSFAPHDVSMVLGLANEMPDKVLAVGSSFITAGLADIATAHLQFKTGLRAHISVSWLHPYKEQKIVVVAEKGMAVFDDGEAWDSKLQLYPHQIIWKDGVPYPEKASAKKVELKEIEPLLNECQHFIDCITTKRGAKTDGEEGVRVLKVLDAAQRSLDSGNTVTLSEVKQSTYFKHETAIVDDGCEISDGTKIWHFSHIIKGTKIGSDCVVGQNVMIGPDVVVGDRCKIQNNVSLYKGVVLEDGVFCGPSCVFTNVHNPRSEIERKDEFRITNVGKGTTIGANATIVCGVKLGAYSFVGAGAVVTKDIKPHALVVGNPARQVGWMSHSGEKLGQDLICPREKRQYRLTSMGDLEEIIEIQEMALESVAS